MKSAILNRYAKSSLDQFGSKRKEVDCKDRANLKKKMRLDQEISKQGSTLF